MRRSIKSTLSRALPALLLGASLLAATPAGATPVALSGTLAEAGQASHALGAFYPGDRLRLTLTAATTVDFACGAANGAGGAIWSGAGTAYPKSVIYNAPATGPVQVSALARSNAGSGTYKMLAYVKRRTAITIVSSPSTVSFGKASTVKAKLTSSGGSTVVANKYLRFYSSADGKTWKYLKSVTSPTGYYAISVTPVNKTYYRAVFAGNTGDEGHFGSTSRTVYVTPRVYLTGPTVPSSMTPNKTYSLSGYLKPKHAAGASSVRVQAQYYSGSQWVTKKTFYAKNADYSSSTTRWTAKVALPYKGRWRLRAYAPADSKHAATFGTWRYTSAPAQRASAISAWVSDSTPSPGQTVNIYAKLKDPYGKPIANAKVTMTAVNNGVSRTREMVTDASGVALWAWCP